MDYRRQIRLVALSVFLQGLYYLRNILLLPIFTRCLGPDGFGVWSKLHALAQVLFPVVALGVLQGMERFLPSADNKKRGEYISGAIVSLCVGGAIAAVCLGFFASQLAGGLNRADLKELPLGAMLTSGMLVATGGMVFCMTLAHLTSQAYRLTDRPRGYGIAIFAQVVGLAAGGCFFWYCFGRSQWVPLLTWTVGPGVVGLVCLVLLLRDHGWRPRTEAVRTMVRYGAPLLLAPTLIWIAHFADLYLLSWLREDLGAEVIGMYAAQYRLGGLVAMVASPFLLFYIPETTRLWDAGETQDAVHFTRQSLKYMTVAALPLVLAAPVLGTEGIRWIAGEGFGGDWRIVFFVMLGYLFLMWGMFAERPLALQKRPWTLLGVAATVAATNVGLNVCLIPLRSAWGGALGAAVATAGSFGIYVVLARVFSGSGVRGWLGCWSLLRVLLAGLCGMTVVWQLAGLTGWVLGLAGGMITYAACLLLLRVVLLRECRVLMQVVRRRNPPTADLQNKSE